MKSPVAPCTHMVLFLSLPWDSPVSSYSIQLQRGFIDCTLYCLIEKPFHSLSKAARIEDKWERSSRGGGTGFTNIYFVLESRTKDKKEGGRTDFSNWEILPSHDYQTRTKI